jgi:predicted RNA methylase
MFRSEEVQHTFKTVQDNIFIHGTELSIENRRIINNAINLARKITIVYATFQTIAAFVFLVDPMFTFEVMLQRHNATNISSERVVYNRTLPVRFWTTLDLTRSKQFEFTHLYTYTVLQGSAITLYSVAIETFCMTTFIYLTGQFELLCYSIRNASEKVKYRIEKRQHSSGGSNGITKRLKFTADKKTKIQYSRADTELAGSAKGKGNNI